jgi:hypothetical protein
MQMETFCHLLKELRGNDTKGFWSWRDGKLFERAEGMEECGIESQMEIMKNHSAFLKTRVVVISDEYEIAFMEMNLHD